MPQFNPTMPTGSNIFREIGAQAKIGPSANGGQSAVENDLNALLQAGDLPSLMKAQNLVQKVISQKVGSVAPNAAPPPPVAQGGPTGPSMAPTPAPTPEPTPTPSPASGGTPAASQSVIADLTKLIAAVGKIHGGGTPGTVSAQATPPPSAPTMPSNAPAAPAPGITGMQAQFNQPSPRNPLNAMPGRPTL